MQREIRKAQASEKGTLQRAEELEEEIADMKAQLKARSPKGGSAKAAESAKRAAEDKLRECQGSEIEARKSLALVQKTNDDSQKEKRMLQKELDGLKQQHQKLKVARSFAQCIAPTPSPPPHCALTDFADPLQNVKKLAQLEAEVDGAVSLTPEEIIFLQEENRELKSWGHVSQTPTSTPTSLSPHKLEGHNQTPPWLARRAATPRATWPRMVSN